MDDMDLHRRVSARIAHSVRSRAAGGVSRSAGVERTKSGESAHKTDCQRRVGFVTTRGVPRPRTRQIWRGAFVPTTRLP